MPRHQARGGERQPRQRLLQDDEIARDANDNGQIVSRQRVSDEVRRRREHFVAVALDCCPRWWISSADRPLQHAEHDGATVSRHDEFSDGRACAPSHRSSSAWSLEHDQDNIDCAGLSEEGAHTPASSWQNSTTFHTYTFKGPIEGLSNSQSILPAAHKAQAQGQGGMGERACCSEELRRARCGKGGWLGTGFTKSFTHTHKRGQCALLLIALVQFALWQPTDDLLICSSVEGSLPDPEQILLLGNILLAMGQGAGQLPQMDIVEWPPYPNARGDSDEVREFLATLIKARIDSKSAKTLLLMGDAAAEWLLTSDEKAATANGQVSIFGQITALLVPSLREMIEQPSSKRKTWQTIRFLSPQRHVHKAQP